MSSEKPFWEGKTCKEMAGLHVKATWKNGTIVTGVLDDTGDIDLGDNRSLYTSRVYDSSCDFEPIDNIQSIELLDDPEYERIDNIEDVREGDVYVGTDGNRYTVLQRTTSNLQPLTVAVINTTFYPHRSYFGYALRPTPKLPDHDGLWLDRVGNTWTMCDGKVHIIRISDGDWCFTRPWFYTDSVQVVNAGPFRPAKAVEA